MLALALLLLSDPSLAFDEQRGAIAMAAAEIQRVSNAMPRIEAEIAAWEGRREPAAARRILTADVRELEPADLRWRVRHESLRHRRASLDTSLANAIHRYREAMLALKYALKPLLNMHEAAQVAIETIQNSGGHPANKRRAIATIRRDLATYYSIRDGDTAVFSSDFAKVLEKVRELIAGGQPHKVVVGYLLQWSGAQPVTQGVASGLFSMAASTFLHQTASDRINAWNKGVRQVNGIMKLARGFAEANSAAPGAANIDRLIALIDGIDGMLSSGRPATVPIKLSLVYARMVLTSIRTNYDSICFAQARKNLIATTVAGSKVAESKSPIDWPGYWSKCPFGRVDFMDWELALVEDPSSRHHPRYAVKTFVHFNVGVPESYPDSAWIWVAPADAPVPASIKGAVRIVNDPDDDWSSDQFLGKPARNAHTESFDFGFRTPFRGRYVARLFSHGPGSEQPVSAVYFDVDSVEGWQVWLDAKSYLPGTVIPAQALRPSDIELHSIINWAVLPASAEHLPHDEIETSIVGRDTRILWTWKPWRSGNIHINLVAPDEPGKYEVRLYDSGEEVAISAFEVEGLDKCLKGNRKLRLSAERGNLDAQLELATLYYIDSCDILRSIIWHRAAARQGSNIAATILGHLYINGEYKGVLQDLMQGYMWAYLGVTMGRSFGRTQSSLLDDAAENMTPAEILEAKRLARDWVEKWGHSVPDWAWEELDGTP